jgi:replicative superfamily II helicase
VAEYKNIVGRAGRLGLAEKGRSFVIAANGMAEHQYWNRYVLGTPEDIVSRFPINVGVPASLITRILASAEVPGSNGLTAAEILDFLAKSYAAYLEVMHNPDWSLDQARFERSLAELARAELVAIAEDARYTLTPLGQLAGRTGTDVVSILRLSDALRTVGPAAISPEALITATQLTVELDETRVPLNRRSTQQEPGTWAPHLARIGVPSPILFALRAGAAEPHAPTMRAKRAVACLLWMSDMSLAEIERTLTRHVREADAAGDLRSVVNRTLDLLPTTMAVAHILHPDLELSDSDADLMARLQLGVPATIAPLARLAGTTLARADYLALAHAGLGDLDALERADDDQLEQILGDRSRVRPVRSALARRATDTGPISLPLDNVRLEQGA